MNAFRFGINWARVEPQEGVYGEVELNYYDHLIHCIHAAGTATPQKFTV